MALLEQLAEGCFRKLDDGWAFRPWRVVGTPYRVAEDDKPELAGFIARHCEAAALLLAARLIAELILADDMPETFAGLVSPANAVTAAGLVVALLSYVLRVRGMLAAPLVPAPWPEAAEQDETDKPATVFLLAATGGVATASAAILTVLMLIDGDLDGTAAAAVGAGLIGTFTAPYVREAVAALERWRRGGALKRRDP